MKVVFPSQKKVVQPSPNIVVCPYLLRIFIEPYTTLEEKYYDLHGSFGNGNKLKIFIINTIKNNNYN
jgi:hypothetical protein